MTGCEKNTPNRLIKQKSPYLRQHAYNPVDWWPWCEEAFAAAQAADKPIFLSIGYSTCHWCHVMGQESFEDQQVAELLNQNFIAIKVDREERPDVDGVYMAACQALTGTGGWPLTVIMTPNQQPFFAGTYFPKLQSYGRMGLMELLAAIAEQWREDRSELLTVGKQLTAFLQKPLSIATDVTLSISDLLRRGAAQLTENFDSQWGGFGVAPKFPAAHNLLFLLAYSRLYGEPHSQTMVEYTLVQMYRGGIFDHIGGGFSRYATDQKWLIPHFEKMLYDNALLADIYVEAFQLTGLPLYRRVAESIFAYVKRELTHEQGGFYCAQDADSQGEEGKYYSFTSGEMEEVLGQQDGQLFCRWFGFSEGGNFAGKNIANLLDNADYAQEDQALNRFREMVYQYRGQRYALATDDKILTSWNGLMIAVLAKAGRIFDVSAYTAAAEKAQRFVNHYLRDDRGRLQVRWKDGEAVCEGQLDDYAFYGLAMIELYRTTFAPRYLALAITCAETIEAQFADVQQGGFYLSAAAAEALITRPKEVYDGAMPCGNSAAGMLLTNLAHLTGEQKWRQAAGKQADFMAAVAAAYPNGFSFGLLALLEDYGVAGELICVTGTNAIPQELAELMRRQPLRGLTIWLKTPENQLQLAEVAPFTAAYPLPEQGERYYFCRKQVCEPPQSDLKRIAELLNQR